MFFVFVYQEDLERLLPESVGIGVFIVNQPGFGHPSSPGFDQGECSQFGEGLQAISLCARILLGFVLFDALFLDRFRVISRRTEDQSKSFQGLEIGSSDWFAQKSS
ncbi:hypothetical protein NPIL_696251 [Nephila pilipes]|uniref:Uncharacterized protein n=1 Tax=Nephila pilipes TaxID=299642 RepID=A0A8X6K393_NEPPI|nr:hypothetical protein NPIL_696251 [Nephila pilipes]